MMKVLLLHGKESQPGGRKAQAIQAAGHDLVNPDLRFDWDEAVQIAQRAFDLHNPDVVVGSSRGGAIAINIDTRGAPRVLIAPAWNMFGSENSVSSNTTILHCKEDRVVPYEDSVDIAARTGSKLICVGRSHRMSDSEALEALVDQLG
tara:strand:- start:197 stop:640 length:444 start_codon:yes stop_codon:yes gene_type:complete